MADKSDAEGIVWLFVAGCLAWLAYEKWWKDDELPTPPSPLYTPDKRPSGMMELGADSDGTTRYLDADSVAGSREKRRGWIISYHDKDKTVEQRETKQMMLANCDEGSFTMPSFATYDKEHKVLSSWDESDSDKSRVYHPAPGTIGETNFDAVCDHHFDPVEMPPPVMIKP